MREKIIFLFFLLIPITSSAQGLIPCNGPDCSICDLLVLINNIYLFVMTWSPVVAAFRIGYAGILMIINGSNAGKIGEARKSIQNTLFWLVIIYCSFLIVNGVIHLVPVREELKGSWYKFTCESKDPGLGGTRLKKVVGGKLTLDRTQPNSTPPSEARNVPPSSQPQDIGKFNNESRGSLSYPKDLNPTAVKDCIDKAIHGLAPSTKLKGEWFARAGSNYNVNPAFLAAIGTMETQLATANDSRTGKPIDYSKIDPKWGGKLQAK